MNMQLKEGDNFIRISKYGHVFGVVKSIKIAYKDNLKLKLRLSYIKVISTNDVEYNIDEVYKIEKYYTDEEVDKIGRWRTKWRLDQ